MHPSRADTGRTNQEDPVSRGEGEFLPPPDPALAELKGPDLARTTPSEPEKLGDTSTQTEFAQETDTKQTAASAKEEKLSLGEMISASADIIKIAFTDAKKLAWARAGLAIPTAVAGSGLGILTGALIDSVNKSPDALFQDPKTALWALLGGSVAFGLTKTLELITQHRFQTNKVQTIDTHMRDGLRSQAPSELISKEFQTKLATVRGENWRIYEFCGKPIEAWTNTLQVVASLATVGWVGATALPPLIIGGLARAGAALWDQRDFDKMFNQLKDKYQISNNVWYQFLIPSVLKEMVLTQKDEKVAEIGRKISDEIREVQNKVNTRSALRHLGAEVVGYGALGVALYNCLAQVQAGAMSAGELSAVIVAAAQFSGATTGLIENTVGQLKSISIVKKFLELCQPSPPPERSAETEQRILQNLLSTDTVPEIKFENASFSYPQEADEDRVENPDTPKEPFGLKNVSFTLRPGEVVGIAGQNGAGKSTIINLILGLYKAEGVISANGVNLSDLNIQSEWLPRVGVLLQDHSLFTGLNIQEQIISESTKGFSALKPRFDLREVADASGVASEIRKFDGGYKAIIGDALRKGVKLSGGQQQKVALARALEPRPDILILDEPTASLDATAAKDLLPNLRKFCEEHNYHPTILVVTHKMDLFPQCDRILVMKDGKLQGEGTHGELMQDSASVYFKLFNDYKNEPEEK